MNNNLLFFGLAGFGLWYLSKPKTAAPVNPTSALPYAPSAPVRQQPVQLTPGEILTNVTGAVTDAANAWGTIKNAVGGIKATLPPTQHPAAPPKTGVTTPPTWGGATQSITYNEPYGSDGGSAFQPETQEAVY